MMLCKAVFELFQKLHLLNYGSQFALLNMKSRDEEKKSQKSKYLENQKGF